MSYHPITDLWILARAKLKPNADGSENKYYGAYPGGFPERARVLLGVTITDPVLHVCGGKAKFYPYVAGFGVNDKTLDLDASLNPDFTADARESLPLIDSYRAWPAILADPPYSEQDAEKYAVGSSVYPNPNDLLKNCIEAVRVGGRVGILHYIWPSPPKNAKSIACIGVVVGFNNRIRVFSVFERTE